MVTTDSIELYEMAWRHAEQFSQGQQRYHQQGQQGGHSSSYNTSTDLELYYIRIVSAMFYELMTKRTSGLLSMLCSFKDFHIETVNFNVTYKNHNRITYDLLPLMEGLNTAITKSLNECSLVYSKYSTLIFQGKEFVKATDYVAALTAEIRTLDDNIGLILSPSQKCTDEPSKKIKQSESPKAPETILRTHDPKLTDKLNRLAVDRQANDAAMSEQIQQLQVSLQDELKQIMSIREGIDYSINQEAIKQLLSLFDLVNETLQYHPNDESSGNYHNLIESCEDFLENIKQSLAMLGVTIINDIDGIFDPEMHRAVRGAQPTRSAIITKIIKIGFAYKDKVLEKAEVELA
jgi:molecular chaperone GrpE (heat shock protein)